MVIRTGGGDSLSEDYETSKLERLGEKKHKKSAEGTKSTKHKRKHHEEEDEEVAKSSGKGDTKKSKREQKSATHGEKEKSKKLTKKARKDSTTPSAVTAVVASTSATTKSKYVQGDKKTAGHVPAGRRKARTHEKKREFATKVAGKIQAEWSYVDYSEHFHRMFQKHAPKDPLVLSKALTPLTEEQMRFCVWTSTDPQAPAESLPTFIKSLTSDWHRYFRKETKKEQYKVTASPYMLVVCQSGIRAADVARMLAPFNQHIRVAKLFAKHMKVGQQAEFLAKQDVRIGCGTPNRLQALIEHGGLRLDRLKFVVVDTWQNVKGYSVMSQPQIAGDFFKFYSKTLHERVQSGETKLCFF